MLSSLLLYVAVGLMGFGVVRRRRPGGRRALALGGLMAGIAVALPARRRGVRRRRSRLDELVPEWQFSEHHRTRVRASCAEIEVAVRAVTAGEIRFFRTLTRIRQPRQLWGRVPESILAPAPARPILEVAVSSGFVLLAEEPGRELVLGLLVAAPPGEAERRRREGLTAERFRTLSAPGYAKAAIAFGLRDEGGGWTALSTETRVFATDAATARRFALYWRAIYPGSALIRRMWLRAIRERAERAAVGWEGRA
jgi:hypothetical protein